MERRAFRLPSEEIGGRALDTMAPELKIRLRPGWHPAGNPTIPTYHRAASAYPGALQFSVAQFRHGIVPNTNEQTLISICENLTSKVRGRRDITAASGTCDFGIYGSVTAYGDAPVRFQAWMLSNGQEFVLVTHTCESVPDPQEVREANEIALMTGWQ